MSPDRRRRRPRGEGSRLRNEILEAATQLLTELGDARQLTMRAVAEAVGVTPPSIYLHFSDKASLLEALVERGFRSFDQTLDRAGQGASEPCEVLRARCLAYARFAFDRPGEYRVLFSAVGLGPGPLGTEGKRAHPGAASFFSLVRSVEACLEDGEPAFLRAVQLWSFLHGLVDLMITKPEFPWPSVDDVVDSALQQLGLRSAGRPDGDDSRPVDAADFY